MKIWKKIMALFFTAGMVVSMAGCAQNAEDPGGGQTQTGKGQESAAAQSESQSSEVTAMGRYMETEYALPEGAETYGRKLRIADDGTFVYYDSSIGLWTSADEGQTWMQEKTAEEVCPEAKDAYVNGSAIGPDKSVALCLMHYGEEDVTGTVVYEKADGSRIWADAVFEDGDFVRRMEIAPDGTLYIGSLRGKVCKLDEETGTLEKLFTATECPEVMAFSGKLLLALENDRVEIFDLSANGLQESDPVLDDFCKETLNGKLGGYADGIGAGLIAEEEGILYIACDDGVYRHVLGGTVMEQLVNGEYSSFGDPTVGMCDAKLLADGDFLVLTSGESMIRYTYDPDEPTVPEIQLKVYSLKESDRMRQAISLFQRKHPEAYVKYEVGYDGNSGITLSDAIKNLNLELMGGNGPDVLLLDGMDVEVYATKGLLSDLSPILEELTGENAVFEKIAGAYQTEEGTFVIPANFGVPLLMGRTEDVEKVSDLASLAELVADIKGKLPEASVTGSFNAWQELTQLFEACSPAWLKDGQLDEEALGEFLTLAAQMYEADINGVDSFILENFGYYQGARPVGNVVEYMQVDMNQIAFGLAESFFQDLGSIDHFMQKGDEYSFKPFEGQAGSGFVPVNLLSVPKAASQPELAQEFVKLFLSEEIQDTNMYDGFPVNRASFDAQRAYEGENATMSSIGSWQMPDGREMEMSHEFPKPETTDTFLAYVERLDNCLEGNSILEETVLEYGVQVLAGELSVDEAVEKISQDVEIYLAELK